jgi:tRNA U55 pseudouridine synthase TruB
LHNGAHLTSLCRTRIGEYKLSEAFEIEDLREKYKKIEQ